MINTKKEITCPVCASNHKKVILPDTLGDKKPQFGYNFSSEHNKTYQMVRCLDCSHVYSSPISASLWKDYISVKDDAYLKNEKSRHLTSKQAIKQILNFSPSGGKLLDVGCATGDFILEASKHYSVEGLELSSWSAKIAQERSLKIHQCLLEDLKEEKIYDVVTLWGVIEHFEDPKKEIAHIARILRSKGIIALWTGDSACLLSRILGRKWWYVQGQHIQMFTKKSLTLLMEKENLVLESMEWYPYTMSYGSVVKSLNRYPILNKIAAKIIRLLSLENKMITITLPGEMFAIFRKR